MFDFLAYNRAFLRQQGQNDAASYGVKIQKVGGARYRCIGVHHLTPDENGGNHHVYLDVLDAQGKRVYGIPIGWDWVGRTPAEPARPVAVDKRAGEPGSNIGLGLGQIATVWVLGDGPSDRVYNLRTDHPDEAPGNTRGHHSFYVVFQEGEAAPAPTPDPTPEPLPEPMPIPATPTEQQLREILAGIVPVLTNARDMMTDMVITIETIIGDTT